MPRQYYDANGNPIGASAAPAPAPKRRYYSSTGEPLDAGPVEGGFLDRVSNMGLSDWTALGTRIGGGLLSNVGGLYGAALGVGTEGLAQIQEGDFKPWQIVSQGLLGAIPFGKFIGASSKPLLEGAGLIDKAVNAATNVGAGIAKGGAMGATTTGIDRAVAEGRAPTREELYTGTLMGAAGGGLAAGLARRVAGAGGPSGGPTAAPSPRTTPPAGSPPPTPPPPPGPPVGRILKGRDMYRGNYPQVSAIEGPSLFSQRQPYVREMGDPPPPLFSSPLDDAAQLPLGAAAPQSADDLIAELLDIPPLPRSSFAKPTGLPPGGTGDPVDILTEVMASAGYNRPPLGAVGPGAAARVGKVGLEQGPLDVTASTDPLAGKVSLMDRLRESADQGRAPFARPGDPEILPPAAPGWEPTKRQSFNDPDATPDDLIAELLGGARTGDYPQPRPPFLLPARAGGDVPAMPAAATEDLAAEVSTLPAAQQAAIVRQFSELNPEEGRELRRILAEMNEFRFERGMGAEAFEDAFDERIDRRTGWRGGLLQHTAGAPVFHDIMGGTKGTRRSVIDALDRFINQGKRPTRIAQRAIDVARGRLAGEWGLSKPTLPPDAGDIRPVAAFDDVPPEALPGQSIDDMLAELGAEPVAPKPKIPLPITRAWQSLRPRWAETVAAQQGDDIPFTVDPSEDLLPFAKRIIGAKDPRKLMGAERKALKEVEANEPDALEQLRQMLGADAGGDAGELGAIDPSLLHYMGSTAGGAIAGPLLDGSLLEGEDPTVGAVGGGLTGLLGAIAVKNPSLLRRMRSSGLFSGAAIPKSLLGNAGGIAAYGLEHPGSGRAILEETFNPETTRALKEGFKRPWTRQGDDPTLGVFSYAGRAIGAPDAASRDIIQRVEGRTKGGNLPGIPTPAQAAAGGEYTMSGDPFSEVGRWLMDKADHPVVNALAPVMRTPINWIERGLERLPGIGATKTVRGWTGADDAGLVGRRQKLGAGALAAGMGIGAAAAAAPAGEFDVNPLPVGPQSLEDVLPFAAAAAGPFGLPLTIGVQGGKALAGDRNNAPLDALEAMARETQDSLPLPTPYGRVRNMLRSYVPYSAAMRALSPVDPRDLDTSGSFFGPTLAQVPFLNELLFERKPKGPRRPTVQFGKRGGQ